MNPASTTGLLTAIYVMESFDSLVDKVDPLKEELQKMFSPIGVGREGYKTLNGVQYFPNGLTQSRDWHNRKSTILPSYKYTKSKPKRKISATKLEYRKKLQYVPLFYRCFCYEKVGMSIRKIIDEKTILDTIKTVKELIRMNVSEKLIYSYISKERIETTVSRNISHQLQRNRVGKGGIVVPKMSNIEILEEYYEDLIWKLLTGYTRNRRYGSQMSKVLNFILPTKTTISETFKTTKTWRIKESYYIRPTKNIHRSGKIRDKYYLEDILKITPGLVVEIKFKNVEDLLNKIKKEVGKLEGTNKVLRKMGFIIDKEKQ